MDRTLGEIAAQVGGTLEGDPSVRVRGVAGLREAGPDEVAFLANGKYGALLAATKAAAVLVAPGAPRPPLAAIRVADPSLAFMSVSAMFAPAAVPRTEGVHPSAVVDPSATIGEGVSVGPLAVVEAGACIGRGTTIRAHAYVGHGAMVGEDCLLYPFSCVREGVILGDRVILQPGAVVGSDGFGYVPVAGRLEKIPQTGTVVLEDDVEIGANTTIDRARFGRTVVARGAKIDNLVQIAHNVAVGEGSVLCAQVGIAGSTQVGKGVTLAGQVGVNGHIQIGDGVTAAGKTGITKSVPPGRVLLGNPAQDHAAELRFQARLRRVPDLVDEVKRLRERLAELSARVEHLEKDPAHDPDAR